METFFFIIDKTWLEIYQCQFHFDSASRYWFLSIPSFNSNVIKKSQDI